MRKNKVFQVDTRSFRAMTVGEDDVFYSNDTEAYLIFTVSDPEFEFDKVIMYLTSPEYGKVITEIEIFDAGQSTVEYEVPSEVMNRYGRWRGQIVFEKDGEKASSALFDFSINRFLTAERLPSLTDMASLEDLRNDARELIDEVGELIDDITTTHQEIEQAEAQRVSDESARVSAEEQRKTDHANRSAEIAGKADKVSLVNILDNGDFRDGVTGWSTVRGDLQAGNGTVFFTPTETSSRIVQNSKFEINHVYYHAMRAKATGSTPMIYPTSPVGASQSLKGNGEWEVVSVNHKPTVSNTEIRYVNGGAIGVPIEVDWIIGIDLTQTFGAGNEPTKEEMDELIKNTGYIDGEYALNNKEMLGYLMKGIREKASKKQEDWITPTLMNGWQTYPDSPFQYRKDSLGMVHFRGRLNPINKTDIAFCRMPESYRPTAITHLNWGNDLYISVTPSGICQNYFTKWVSLNGFSFEAAVN